MPMSQADPKSRVSHPYSEAKDPDLYRDPHRKLRVRVQELQKYG